jgi:hypothetical protein
MATKMNPGFMAMMAKKKGAGKDEKPAGGKHKMPDGKMMKDSAMKKMAKGGGIEVKGKTKGTMIAMKKGGKC